MGLNSKTLTYCSKSDYRQTLLQESIFSAAFTASIPEETASTMSWDDQVSAEESRDLVKNAPKSTQRFQAFMLGLSNLIHRSAESSS